MLFLPCLIFKTFFYFNSRSISIFTLIFETLNQKLFRDQQYDLSMDDQYYRPTFDYTIPKTD